MEHFEKIDTHNLVVMGTKIKPCMFDSRSRNRPGNQC